jgi:AAA+ superfamily predicted ATPase
MEPRNSLGQPQRSGGEQVVQRLVFDATKPDLSLSPEQKDALRAIVLDVRAQPDTAISGTRGAGVTALFVVPDSATAMKATAVLANEIGRDVYRVDLGQVVSRYVGETEKNLTRVFDEAQRAGAVLFFDEADALFGKRTDVKDAHDRYANLDISYLLERLEEYEGLMILATNRRENVDDAFIRRIRYVVSFE